MNLLCHGYFFYVFAEIPAKKDPEATDRKLLSYYGVAVTPKARSKQKREGIARVQYLRYGRWFLLIATHGRHQFFTDEGGAIKDIRIKPLKFFGYSISHRNGHPSVRLTRQAYRELKEEYVGLATHLDREWLARKFMNFPYPPYAPIRRQAFNILRAVNRRRRAAGLPLLDNSVIRIKREPVRPFAEVEAGAESLLT